MDGEVLVIHIKLFPFHPYSLLVSRVCQCGLIYNRVATLRKGLKGLDATTYIAKGAPSVSGSPLLRLPQLSVLAVKQFYNRDLLGSYLDSV